MINALIQNGDQTAVLKLPDDPFTLQYDLSQIGIRIRLRDIPIKDDENSALQVKLFADSDIGNNLALLFKPSHSLEDANLCAHMVENARPEILEELEQHKIGVGIFLRHDNEYGGFFIAKLFRVDSCIKAQHLLHLAVEECIEA